MGCTTSKQARHDLRRSPSPLALPRSHSFPARFIDGNVDGHVVLLTSSTLGSLELDKAATWPEGTHAHRKVVPRTPTETPPNEPEAIDAWALMAGLEEYSPAPTMTLARHSFSFPINTSLSQDDLITSSKVTPLPSPTSKNDKGKVSKAVLYFTTLRGVRDTYEDCCLVRAILKGYGVRVDERDVSMHRGFRDELHDLLGLRGPGHYSSTKCRRAALPSLFIDGDLVGDAEEVKRLHEAGELAARLAGCEKVAADEARACEACGDVRFVLCEVCSGSCKLYVDGDSDGEEEVVVDGDTGAGLRRCPECNENGIVRCPICCS